MRRTLALLAAPAVLLALAGPAVATEQRYSPFLAGPRPLMQVVETDAGPVVRTLAIGHTIRYAQQPNPPARVDYLQVIVWSTSAGTPDVWEFGVVQDETFDPNPGEKSVRLEFTTTDVPCVSGARYVATTRTWGLGGGGEQGLITRRSQEGRQLDGEVLC